VSARLQEMEVIAYQSDITLISSATEPLIKNAAKELKPLPSQPMQSASNTHSI
jgi:hypothetical protein